MRTCRCTSRCPAVRLSVMCRRRDDFSPARRHQLRPASALPLHFFFFSRADRGSTPFLGPARVRNPKAATVMAARAASRRRQRSIRIVFVSRRRRATHATQRFLGPHESVRTIRYDTLRDASSTCARKPIPVSLIYRTEPTTKKSTLRTVPRSVRPFLQGSRRDQQTSFFFFFFCWRLSRRSPVRESSHQSANS